MNIQPYPLLWPQGLRRTDPKEFKSAGAFKVSESQAAREQFDAILNQAKDYLARQASKELRA